MANIFTDIDKIAAARRHQTIAASDVTDISGTYRAIVILTDGNVSITDEADVTIVYPFTAGTLYPFSPKRINSTGTTSTVVGVF